MKSVLISIQPKWCELIASGKKTVEVRKTKPKLKTPFKVYIYCTKNFKNNKPYSYKTWASYGKVIGEFVCDSVYQWNFSNIKTLFGSKGGYFVFCEDLKATCLEYEEFIKYGNSKTVYGWHISNLVIYDKPRELYHFQRPCNNDCENCEYLDVAEVGAWEHTAVAKTCLNFITRPPQSWCYVEECEG